MSEQSYVRTNTCIIAGISEICDTLLQVSDTLLQVYLCIIMAGVYTNICHTYVCMDVFVYRVCLSVYMSAIHYHRYQLNLF